MNLLIGKFEQLACGWNHRPLGEKEFYQLCDQFNVSAQETLLQTNGFYFSVNGNHFIAVNKELCEVRKLFVQFHEFAHFLLHSPAYGAGAKFHGVSRKTRQEAEADLFALCAIMPRPLIEGISVQELTDDHGLPDDLVDERIKIYRTHDI